MITKYEHHGAIVYVDSKLKGKHRKHCLCHKCLRFTPDTRETNCETASRLFYICVQKNIVTPVWECPDFVEKNAYPYVFFWSNTKERAALKGKYCKIVEHIGRTHALIEFTNGKQLRISRRAIRRRSNVN